MEAPGRPRRWGGAPFAAMSLLLGFLGGFGGAVAATLLLDEDGHATTPVAVSVGERVASSAAPSIVSIVTEEATGERGRLQLSGIGSGVIIDKRGFIVTNEHVVRGARRLTIVLENGEERRGVLVGHDRPFTDLAVIKLEGGGTYPAIRLGDSNALRLGEPVVAIGHSLTTFATSVTTGVVSGVGREWLVEGTVLEDLVQTDAALNHGNSGGALLNSRGELIGIPTTVLFMTAEGDPVEGISLAISSRTVSDVAIPIIESGRKPRPYIGVDFRDVTREVAAQHGLGPLQGALVTVVAPGSPADQAGLRPNDLITGLGGSLLTPDRPYANALMHLPTDKPAEIRIIRDGARLTLTLTPIVR